MNHKPVLHLVFDDKFIDRAIFQFEKALPGQHNYLLDIPKSDYQIKYVKQHIDKVCLAVRGSKDYLSKIKEAGAEVVILHSMSYYYAHIVNTLLSDKKVIWIFWGGEVYDYLKEFRNNNFKRKTRSLASRYLLHKNLRNWLRPFFFKLKNPSKVWNFSKYEAFSKIDGLALAHKDEFKTLSTTLNFTTQLHWFTYYSIEHLISDDVQNMTVNGDNILIGNSATPSNNHLDILFRIKEEISIDNRKLILPLSYGENWYRKKIQNTGTSLFPNNLQVLADFMPLSEYNKVVFSCSVVIMNHLRQQAVGNLIVSFWIGAKVFLDESNPLFAYFKGLGLIVFSIQKDLKSIELNEKLTDKDVLSQRKILLLHYSEANVIENTRVMLSNYLESL